jgi:hypothetical protein
MTPTHALDRDEILSIDTVTALAAMSPRSTTPGSKSLAWHRPPVRAAALKSS